MSIEAQHISKTYGAFRALNDVSLRVETGELVALLGPSGSGKTTLLRVIAGLEQPDASAGGSILFGGEDVRDRPVAERHVGFVFQHYALFRHMTVLDNVTFGLRARPWSTRPSRTEVRDKAIGLLRLVQLEGLARRYPAQLSGGQRQRVALARALAVEPEVLLLDEPFGALDAKVRRELRRWLRRLHDQLHVTTVFVTHDQEEALEVADRVAILNRGRIEQIGTPEDVHENPTTPFVYDFLGKVNLFHGRLSGGEVEIGGARVRIEGGGGTTVEAKPAVAYVRPHDVEILRDAGPDGDAIAATGVNVNSAGPSVSVHLARADNDEPIEAALSRERYRVLKLKQADRVFVRLRNPRVFSDDYSI